MTVFRSYPKRLKVSDSLRTVKPGMARAKSRNRPGNNRLVGAGAVGAASRIALGATVALAGGS